MNYTLAYAVGVHRWEEARNDPGFVAQVPALFDRAERGRPGAAFPECG
jgi:hypothetical protein